MKYPIKNQSLCWYCINSCNCHLCSISKGKTPDYAIKNNGYVVECEKFKQDVHFPMSNEEIFNKYGITHAVVNYYYNELIKKGKLNNFLEIINKILEQDLFYLNVAEFVEKRRRKILKELKICELFYKCRESINYTKNAEYKSYFKDLNNAYYTFKKEYSKFGIRKGRLSIKELNNMIDYSKERDNE